MNATELRVKVAEAMGYKVVGEAWAWCPDGAWSVYGDDEAESDFHTREVVALSPHFNPTHDDDSPHACGYPTHALEVVPNFGAPDWSATGAVLDEIDKRWGTAFFTLTKGLLGWYAEINPASDWRVSEHDPHSPHIAVCKAILEAHARAKEPK